ncbi:MAG: hypothetical protein CMB15_04720 [Euryarchaeota archaeon]|nr:hypothetical protein [Euryarchaeota archaeon]|tara:strand:- start:12710 stop:12898 length:189 start_codon:yes stop_codon:yes gene_type:complete
MAPIWPFRKKSSGRKKSSEIEDNIVVEYEREVRGEKKEENNRSHLTNKTFIDAMALLSDEKK